jgi:hypothetical protein
VVSNFPQLGSTDTSKSLAWGASHDNVEGQFRLAESQRFRQPFRRRYRNVPCLGVTGVSWMKIGPV